MATFPAKTFEYHKDPETGCNSQDIIAFEACRQNFFLKQQNQILQNQQENPKPEENIQLKTEIQTQTENVNHTQKESIETIGIISPILYMSILVVAVVATAFITKHIYKK